MENGIDENSSFNNSSVSAMKLLITRSGGGCVATGKFVIRNKFAAGHPRKRRRTEEKLRVNASFQTFAAPSLRTKLEMQMLFPLIASFSVACASRITDQIARFYGIVSFDQIRVDMRVKSVKCFAVTARKTHQN